MSRDPKQPTQEPSAAEGRDWTPEEVAAAVAHIKRERPDVWAELLELERTTGDLRGSDAVHIAGGLLSNLHQECNLYQDTLLFEKVRDICIAEATKK